MLNLLRKFLRPTLREQLEDGVREALRKYAERHAAPNLRVYVSTDLVPAEVDPPLWSRDEAEHLRRFALQWAEDNDVPRAGLRTEVILLDTKREFAFVKPVGVAEAPGASDGAGKQRQTAPGPIVQPGRSGTATFVVVTSPTLREPLRVEGDLTLGRRKDDEGVFGVGDRFMSARHARIHVAGATAWITDLDSKNRTFVNERPLPPHQASELAVGDMVKMGETVIRLAQAN
jgi:hypothetical protein